MSDTQRRHPHLVNLDELEPRRFEKGTRFGYATRWLTPVAGARGVGCSWFEVPPGRTAFPHHFHCANEEALFVLEGEGTLRIGQESVPVRAGDWVTLPPGPDFAHQLLNTGSGPLRYLALSTLLLTDVVGYPDSGKVGARSITLDASGRPHPQVLGVFRQDAQVDYFDGETLD